MSISIIISYYIIYTSEFIPIEIIDIIHIIELPTTTILQCAFNPIGFDYILRDQPKAT